MICELLAKDEPSPAVGEAHVAGNEVSEPREQIFAPWCSQHKQGENKLQQQTPSHRPPLHLQ